jgi:hypothetical protein
MKSTLQRLIASPGFIAVVAFAVRMGVLVHLRLAEPMAVRDNLPYGFELGAVAASIASGHGFSSPLRWFQTGPTAWFGPIYPYLAAGIFNLFGVYSYASRVVLESLNGAFSALTCIPIFLAGRRTFGAAVGAGAAWAWVILPAAVVFPLEWIWDTAFSALCMTVILYATFLLRDSPRARNWAGYGALWAFAALLNPALLAALPFLTAWVVFELRRKAEPWGRGLAACALVFAIGLAPWTIRNEMVFHKLIPLRSNFGLELWLGNNPGTADNDSADEHPDDNLDEARLYRSMGEPAYMALKLREALDFGRSHPADVAGLTFHRVITTWLGNWDPIQDSWRAENWDQRSSELFKMAFSLLALLGALLALRSQNREALPYALVILSYPMVFYLTHGSSRYRHPIDPILTLLAVFALAYPFRALHRAAGARGQSPAARMTQIETIAR